MSQGPSFLLISEKARLSVSRRYFHLEPVYPKEEFVSLDPCDSFLQTSRSHDPTTNVEPFRRENLPKDFFPFLTCS